MGNKNHYQRPKRVNVPFDNTELATSNMENMSISTDYAFIPDIQRRDSMYIHDYWSQYHVYIFPEYANAFELLSLHRQWISQSKLLKALKGITFKLNIEPLELRAKISVHNTFIQILLDLIKKAYPSGNARYQQDVLYPLCIYDALNVLYQNIGLQRQSILTYSLYLMLQNSSADEVIAKFSEVCDRSLRCSSAQRQAFNLLVYSAYNTSISSSDIPVDEDIGEQHDIQERQEAMKKINECVEDYLDEHKEKAFQSSFIEPARMFFHVIGRSFDRDHVNIHAVNWYLALIESSLGMSLPLQSFLSDGDYMDRGLGDFWSGLTSEAWNEFAKPANFGVNFERVFRHEQNLYQYIRRNNLPSGQFPCGWTQQVARSLGNAAVDPTNKPIRQCLSIYLERFCYFFSEEFFVKRCFEVLNAENKPQHIGFRKAAQTLFQFFREEMNISEDSLLEYCYVDDTYMELDISHTAQFFRWTGLLKAEVNHEHINLINCPICFEDKSNVELLPHVHTSKGDISNHKMCSDCKDAYINVHECPFCKEAIQSNDIMPFVDKFVNLMVIKHHNPDSFAAIFEEWQVFELENISTPDQIYQTAKYLLIDSQFIERINQSINENSCTWFRDAAGIFFRLYGMYLDKLIRVQEAIGKKLAFIVDSIIRPLESPHPAYYHPHFYGALYQQALSAWSCSKECDINYSNTRSSSTSIVRRVGMAIYNCYHQNSQCQSEIHLMFERIHKEYIQMSHNDIWGGEEADIIWKFRGTSS